MVELLRFASDSPHIAARRVERVENAGVKMAKSCTFPGLDDPDLLVCGGLQAIHGKSFDDHRLAIGVRPDNHQPLRAQ